MVDHKNDPFLWYLNAYLRTSETMLAHGKTADDHIEDWNLDLSERVAVALGIYDARQCAGIQARRVIERHVFAAIKSEPA